MEVTKRLKPSVKRVTKYGDSASVQAVTRVNAEQASKTTMAITAITAKTRKRPSGSKNPTDHDRTTSAFFRRERPQLWAFVQSGEPAVPLRQSWRFALMRQGYDL